MTPRRKSLAAGALAWALACPAAAQVPEHELKAAFIFNFAAFVDWPEDAQPLERLVLCDRTGPELSRALAGLDGKTIHGHQVAYRDIRGPDHSEGCHAIVLDGADTAIAGNVDAVDRGAAENPDTAPGPPPWWQRQGVLTVADGGVAGRNGAVITLVRDGSRVRFDVDTAAAARAEITLSSKLLRLARRVL